MNVTKAGFAASYFVSHAYWQLVPQRIISANVDPGTAAGINAIRLLKVKRFGELALRLSSHLTFAWGYVAVRAIHLTVNTPLQICVAVPRLSGDAKTRGPSRHTRPTGICGGATAVR